MSSPGGIDKLIDDLDASSKKMRREAAGRLAEAAADPVVAGHLRGALTDRRPTCRWGVAFALDRAGHTDLAVAEVAVEVLGDRDADLRWAAARILTGAAAALPEIRAMLARAASGCSDARAKMALYCLRDLGADERPVFREALSHADTGVRFAALSALAGCSGFAPEDRRAMEEVAATDADAGVRRAARSLLDKRATGG